MRSGEGVEEKEWFVIFGIDEIYRFLTEHIGQVAIEFDPFPFSSIAFALPALSSFWAL
jgi:hypothetical protein